jgi:hypothetical protein
LTVQPVASITVSPASPTAGATAIVTVHGSAACGTVNVDFGDGNVQTFMSESGLPISNTHAWATGGAKTITAQRLGGGCDSLATTNITVLLPPSVSLTEPAAGSFYTSPATIAMSASATAAQGVITQVAFYANGSLVQTDATAPYAVNWTNVADGTYALTAVATDSLGASATSSSVSVVVGTPPPSTVLGVTVTPNPATAGQSATIVVTGTNPCTMLWMEFGDGDWWIAPIDSLPFTTTHTWASAGTYTVRASGYITCAGEATRSVTVNSSAPEPLPLAAVSGPLPGVFPTSWTSEFRSSDRDRDNDATRAYHGPMDAELDDRGSAEGLSDDGSPSASW